MWASTPEQGIETTSETIQERNVTHDDIFNVLSNKRRRYVVHALKNHQWNHGEDAMPIGLLASTIAGWEENETPEMVSSAGRKRVYTALQQQHLPAMERSGIIEFDRNRGMIETNHELDRTDVFMEIISHREIPWSTYYLGMSVVFVGVWLTVWQNVWPFHLLSPLTWGVFGAAIFGLSAIVQKHHENANRLGADELPPELRE